jgi:predicted enzyme related to lactoylglutathione lyase
LVFVTNAFGATRHVFVWSSATASSSCFSQLGNSGLVRPNRLADPVGKAWDAYVWVDNADTLCNEFRAKGVKIARDICDQPYGNRDFDIEDCNGYRLCFGHDAERQGV